MKMPCEFCQAQFTVFRRKRSCSECRRFYCGNCLNSYKRSNSTIAFMCRRCAIFAKRPLLRADLLQLKPKDLIFYLQSKQISIAGCVEKDELINLVLTHAEHVDNLRSPHGERARHENGRHDSGNSFEGIKQTCQNFFTNLTDNISDTFSSFDNKKPEQSQNNSRVNSPTVEQPSRVYFYEMPSYASAQTRINLERNSGASTLQTNGNATTSSSTSNNCESSPSYSVSSTISSGQANNNETPIELLSTSTLPTDKSDCECSDDDIMLNFNERHTQKTENKRKSSQKPSDPVGPSTSKAGSQSSKLDAYDNDSHSSFEELGAIGGDLNGGTGNESGNGNTSDYVHVASPSALSIPTTNSITATTTPTTNENDNESEMDADRPSSEVEPTSTIDLPTVSTLTQPQEDQIETTTRMLPAVREKPKVRRRRSDSYLARRRAADESPTSPTAPPFNGLLENINRPVNSLRQTSIQEVEEPTGNDSRPQVSCTRCGKTKANLKRHVERMRHHLQSSQLSDEEIKQDMKEFLEFIENRYRSVEQSDNDTVYSSASGVYANQLTLGSPSEEHERLFDENEGINVYPSDSLNPDNNSARFINIENFNDLEELEMLTVKELKEVLMLHRIDFKGCCEKQELLERVQRLWKNLKSTPAVEQLPSDDVCKICMDAPIECVLLECGHMATCTSCGKVLNECPICRQYIVRVVRFFRA